jgi:[ribosomal protein S5]-alanine N-acetyltransferase
MQPLLPILQTNRLTLRPLTGAHEQQIFALRSNTQVNKYIHRPLCESMEQASQFIQSINKQINSGIAYYWAIEKHNTNLLIGTICLFSIDASSAETGFELLPEYWGQGIITEALKTVTGFCFNTLNINTVYATAHLQNAGSIKVLTNNGFSNTNKADEHDPNFIIFALQNLNKL